MSQIIVSYTLIMPKDIKSHDEIVDCTHPLFIHRNMYLKYELAHVQFYACACRDMHPYAFS